MSKLPSFEGLVSSLSVGLCVVGDDKRILFANDRLGELLNAAPADLVGESAGEFLRFAEGEGLPSTGTHGACLRAKGGTSALSAVSASPCDGGTCYVVLPFAALESVRWGTTQDRLTRVEQLLDRVERIHGTSQPSGDRDLSSSPLLAQLSRREREIVTALVGARPVKQIAANLNISPHTVRNHLKSSFRKLNVGSQVELVAKLTQGPSMVREASNGN